MKQFKRVQMNFSEYYLAFQKYLDIPEGSYFPKEIAACLAAEYELKLTFEQMKIFLAKRTEITSVTVGLISQTTSPR